MGLKTTPIVYAIHGENQSPVFGEDVIHVTGRDDASGLYITLEMVCPSSVSDEDLGQGKLSINLEELYEINKVVALLKKDWDDE